MPPRRRIPETVHIFYSWQTHNISDTLTTNRNHIITVRGTYFTGVISTRRCRIRRVICIEQYRFRLVHAQNCYSTRLSQKTRTGRCRYPYFVVWHLASATIGRIIITLSCIIITQLSDRVSSTFFFPFLCVVTTQTTDNCNRSFNIIKV